MRPFVLFAALSLFSLPYYSFAQRKVPNAPPDASMEMPPSAEHTLYAPIAGLPAFKDWEVVVVSHSTKPATAMLTVYSASGKPYPKNEVSLAASETKRLDVRSLIPTDAIGDLGGMSIDYNGGSMMIVAQITLHHFRGFGSLDVPFFEDMEFMSSELGSVWWEPTDGFSYLILGNSSSMPVVANVSYASGESEQVQIAPFATVVKPVSYGDDQEQADEGRIQSVHITSNAMAGLLRADGFVASPKTGFFDTVRFFDPGTSMEPDLYANGLHFSHGSPHLLVRNLTSGQIRVSGELYLSGKSSTKPIAIPDVQVPADGSRELRIPPVGDLSGYDDAAIRLRSSGPKGSFVASFTHFDAEQRLTRSVPFKDIEDPSVSTGGYPWRLDGDYTSRVFVTNVGKVKAAIMATIQPVGGRDYEMQTQYLNVGETAVFDIKHLRDAGIPDRKGARLPKNTTVGQFDWSTVMGDGSQRLMGRNEVESPSRGVASSFSCASCNCPYDTNQIDMNPYDPIVAIGLGAPVDTQSHQYNVCNGAQRWGSYIAGSWNIVTPGYFTMHSAMPSTMNGVNGGSSGLSTNLQGVIHHFNGNVCSVQSTPTLQTKGTGNTQKPTTLSGPSAAKTTYNSNEKKDCYGQSENPKIPVWYGYQECESYTVLDQNATQIKAQGLQFDETLEVIATNVGATTQTASGITDSNFTMKDDLSLGSTTHAPNPGSYIVDKQTITYHDTGQTVRINCLDFEATDVSVKDITATPGTTCTRN